MHVRHALVALLAVGTLSAAAPAGAQTPADMTGFSQSCLGASAFLLGDVPESIEAGDILTPLCGCLTDTFAPLPQKDVDVLATDLRGESDDASHAAYGDYAALEETARQGLGTCFNIPEVTAAMDAAAPPVDAAPVAE